MAFRQYFSCLVLAFFAVLPAGAQTVVRAGITGPTWNAGMSCPQGQYVTASPDNLHVFRAINSVTGTAGSTQPNWTLLTQSVTADGTCQWAEWGTSGSTGVNGSGGVPPTTLPNCTAAGTVQGLGLQFSTQTVNGISQLCGTLATASSNSVVALCTSNCGNSGTASVTYNGVAPGILDGLGIANDYVIPSSTPGEFTDIGASKPSGTIETFGIVAQANTGAGTAAQIFVQPASLYFAGTGSNSGNINNAAQYLPAFYSAPGSANVLSGFSACGFNINTGLFSCTLIGSSGLGTGVITMGEGSAPSNPPAGNILLYPDVSNNLHCLTPSGGSCLASGGTPPVGSNGAVQYNNAGSLGGVNDVVAGSRLASAGATSPPIFQTTPYIDVRDAGIDCTGNSDSTTALQNMINNAPDFSKFLFPANCKVLISTTAGNPTAITIQSRYGLEFWGEGREGNSCDYSGSNTGTNGGARIIDSSSYVSGARMLYINQSQRLLFRNMTLESDGAVDVPLDIDQTASPPITTMNNYDSLCVWNNTNTRNPSFIGVRISNVSTNNVEMQWFRNSDIACANVSATGSATNGQAILYGSSFNLKNEKVEGLTPHNCSQDVELENGSDETVLNVMSSSSYQNILDGGFQTLVEGSRFENSNTAIVGINPNPSVHTYIHNDFANDTRPISCNANNGCNSIIAIGNKWDTGGDYVTPNPNGVNTSWFGVGNIGNVFNPTDFANGSFNIPLGSVTTTGTFGQNLATDTFGFYLTSPNPTTVAAPTNTSSPFIMEALRGGASQIPETWTFQTAVANTNADANWLIGQIQGVGSYTAYSSYQQNISTLTPWLAFGGKFSGFNLGVAPTPGIMEISPRNGGTCNYSYEVIGHGNFGTTAASSASSTSLGNCTLGTPSSAFNDVWILPAAGVIYFDVYRTVCGGTGICSTNPTGKIGSIVNACLGASDTCGAYIPFADIGQAGDATSPPSSNTTGYVSGPELTTPSTHPPSGTEVGYFKSGAGWCSYDSTGTERCPGAGGGGTGVGYVGVNSQTTSYVSVSGDSGKLVVMNCSGACTFTLLNSPSATYNVTVISVGSTVATVSLNGLQFNGTSSVPVLTSFAPIRFMSDGTNYWGNAPDIAGAGGGIVRTAASNNITYTDTFVSAATGRYFQSNTGATTLGAAFSANNTNLWSFVAPYSFTSNNVEYYIGTDDNSGNLYDIGIYDVNGNLVCHIGATAGTTFTGATTGMKKLAWASSCSIVAGNRYEFATTGNASTAALGGTSSNSLAALAGVHPSSGGTTSGGLLNSSVTIPTDNFTMSGSTTAPNFGLF